MHPCAMVFSLRLIPSAFLHVPSYKSAVTVMLRLPPVSTSRAIAALKALLFWCGDAHFSSMPLETLPVTKSSSLGRRAQQHLILSGQEENGFPRSQTASPSGICKRRGPVQAVFSANTSNACPLRTCAHCPAGMPPKSPVARRPNGRISRSPVNAVDGQKAVAFFYNKTPHGAGFKRACRHASNHRFSHKSSEA